MQVAFPLSSLSSHVLHCPISLVPGPASVPRRITPDQKTAKHGERDSRRREETDAIRTASRQINMLSIDFLQSHVVDPSTFYYTFPLEVC